ncbi:MAG TPA: hypothetical protein VIK13_09630 [Candidatus Limnocylindrales bacterium]
MKTEPRIAALERSLEPLEATRRWLTEAHDFGSLAAYLRWLARQPNPKAPANLVSARAGQAVVAKMRGRPRAIVDEFRAAAEADAIFLVKLVIEVEVEDAVASAIEGESLRWLALALEFQVLRAEVVGGGGAQCDGSPTPTDRWAAWLKAASERLGALYAAEEGRLLLERRYLDGLMTLFPGTAADWAALQHEAEWFVEGGASYGWGWLFGADEAAGEGAHIMGPSSVDRDALRRAAREQAHAAAAQPLWRAVASTLHALERYADERKIIAWHLLPV